YPCHRHDRVVPGLHVVVPDHGRGTEQRQPDHGVVPLSERLPVLPVRLRLGDCLGHVPDDCAVDRAGSGIRETLGLLRGSSDVNADARYVAVPRVPALFRTARLIAYYAVLTGCALALLAPLGWMVSTSLKIDAQVAAYPPIWIPHPIAWENYV